MTMQFAKYLQHIRQIFTQRQLFRKVNLNKLGRSLLDEASYQISSLGCVVSDKKIFLCFTLYKSM